MGQTSPIIVKIGTSTGDHHNEQNSGIVDSQSQTERTQAKLQPPANQAEEVPVLPDENVAVEEEIVASRENDQLELGVPYRWRDSSFRRERRAPYFPVGRRAFVERKPPLWWSGPAGFGLGTGLLIGFAMLLFFRSVPMDTGGVMTPLAQTVDVSGSAKLTVPGFSIWVYQVGSFGDKTAADKQNEVLKSNGVAAVSRGTSSPFQLLVGVSQAKTSNTSLPNVLKTKSIDYYVKQISLNDSTVTVKGISSDQLSQLQALLQSLLNQVKQEVVNADTMSPLNTAQINTSQTISTSVKQVSGVLQKAGYNQAAASLGQMTDSANKVQLLLQSAKATDEGANLTIEQNLASFYVEYEKLISDLTRS